MLTSGSSNHNQNKYQAVVSTRTRSRSLTLFSFGNITDSFLTNFPAGALLMLLSHFAVNVAVFLHCFPVNITVTPVCCDIVQPSSHPLNLSPRPPPPPCPDTSSP